MNQAVVRRDEKEIKILAQRRVHREEGTETPLVKERSIRTPGSGKEKVIP